ncbi:hypothetical protein SAPIO_CDS1903 [Scedosporium apiospermum]|uniref:Actin-like ATPase domain-containing protein n=1 Tax=Pseudallescheria apiosperma TaxID=563466 RepID=A0A084GE05_PSEDA|nr:uncharacterized protein SAPIO_CDS1903 [Scedosporium apiospermum]KEZ45567.1 hypothetical protein SAPIO_CDS1903 [Scedosporium apiospermum]
MASDALVNLLSRARLGQSEDEDEILIIGIDFGTTFSGVAWATVDDLESDEIHLITTWPGTGREEGKVPTELFYEDGKTMWGFEVPRDGDPVRWFKLLLLKSEDIPSDLVESEFLIRARKMLRENGKTAVDLIADYLRCIWAHAMASIEKARGKSVVDAYQFRVVITVPAIWKGYARQGMKDAARQAGILDYRAGGETELVFAPEPEAAALATLCEKGRKLNKDEVYVVCDAGGGTVDLISYQVASLDPIRLDEAVEGTGGLCGGIFIDEAFERICKARLGRRWDRLSKAGIKEVMTGEWEHFVKPQLKADPANATKEYIISIPAEAFVDAELDDTSREPFIKNGRIHFKGDHLEQAFVEVLGEIGRLIDEQIDKSTAKGKKVKSVILVGGLGASPFLYQFVEQRYAKKGISVLQSGGIKPRTAICRGAILKGILSGGTGSSIKVNGSASIVAGSKISRASFGDIFRTPWIDGMFPNEDKVWCPLEERYFAKNRMEWYIVRGSSIDEQEPVRHSYYRTYQEDFGGIFSVDVHQCEDELAPDRATKTVKHLCTIDCALDTPFSSLPNLKSSSGRVCKKLDFEIEAIPSGASVEFSVYVNGKRLGAQEAEIKFQ